MSITKVPASRMVDHNIGSYCFRNKIINGDMRIDQRNAGSAITPTTNGNFAVDRFVYYTNVFSKITLQQVADAPANYSNSVKLTVASQYNSTTGDVFGFGQNIEGYNIIDLGWGTSAASPVTVSFWIKSSVAGQIIPLWIQNNNNDLNYVTTFTITNANTWQYVTKTIPGPTTGTWSKDNTRGIFVGFGLGGGSNTYTGTVTETWQPITVNNKFMTNAPQFVAQTTGSTLNITGVQLEVGPTATPFEYRPIGIELALCQRYYYREYHFPSGLPSGAFSQYTVSLPVVQRLDTPTVNILGRDVVGSPSGVDTIYSRSRGARFTGVYQSGFVFESVAEL
jgi:hypothetical protein